MNIITRALSSFKAAAVSTVMRFGRGGRWGMGWLGGSRLDIGRRVGDGSHNSIVIACRNWAEKAWPEAPLIVQKINAQGEWQTVADHGLAALLRRPNPRYSGLQLVTATVADRMLTGNGYWRKIRSGDRRVVQLWWIPSWMIAPAWPDDDPTVYIGWYDYTIDGEVERIDPADIVHFRRGFDPNNQRLGRNDLADLLGELFTDEEASAYVAAMMANMGVPGVIISPDGTAGGTAQDDDLEAIKDKFEQRFSGENRGRALVMGTPTKVSVLSFSPEQMKVRELRRIPEERVTAVLGIPAIVAGLGAGLDRSTFANVAEAREAAYESYIIPDHRMFDADLETQLVPDFGDPDRLRVSHDYSQVRVLQDDQNALHERARSDLLAGGITLNQFLGMIGQDVLPGIEGDVRYLPNTVTVKTLDTLIPPKITDVTPTPADQPALPAPAEDAPAKALVGARTNGHSNGKATAVLDDPGPALALSDDELDRLAQVNEADLKAAERLWRRIAEDGLSGLIDAEEGE